jgi:hypothetical protein
MIAIYIIYVNNIQNPQQQELFDELHCVPLYVCNNLVNYSTHTDCIIDSIMYSLAPIFKRHDPPTYKHADSKNVTGMT